MSFKSDDVVALKPHRTDKRTRHADTDADSNMRTRQENQTGQMVDKTSGGWSSKARAGRKRKKWSQRAPSRAGEGSGCHEQRATR